jgi:hypothetical protein
VHLAGDAEVQARSKQILDLLREVCDEGELPYFVSDEASVLDVCSLAPDEILRRLENRYRRLLASADLQLPIWKLVDRLDVDT